MKKILPLLVFLYVNYLGVYVIQAQTQNVSFSDANGISGTISLDISLGYNFEPYFVAKQNKVVIKSYQNGKYDAVLRQNGISFPYTLDESKRFDVYEDIIIQKGSDVIERVSTDFNTTRSLGYGHVFPPFSEKAKEWLKNEGTDKSIVGREMSGGGASWSKYAKIQNVKVVEVYLTDFKNKIEKIIRDAKREQKEQERKLAEEKKQKEEQAKKEQLAKEEADKKVAASDTEKQTSGKQETQSSQNVQSTEGEKTVTGNSENEFKQTAEMKERENAARKKQEDYERQERERVKNLQKKQEYDQRMSQQRSVNQSIAASNATSSMGMLVVLGGFVYSNMGKVSPNNIFRGSNGYFGMDLGYGTNLTPMYFNSSYENMTTGGKIQYRDEVIAAQPFIINFNVRPKLGYEHEKGGGYVYGSFNPGASIVFHATDLTYTYGIRGFGGGKGLQFLFDLEKGQRKLNVNQYIDPQEFGRGKTNIKYTNLKLGAKFDWYPNEYSAARKTLVLGVIKEIISPEIEPDEEWGRFEIQNIKFEEEPNGLYGLFSKDKRSYTGYFLEYQTAHHSKFMISAFPKYPYTGYVAYSKSTLEKESGFYIQISYTRSIDLFF